MDPYKVLGVDRKASEETIRLAYRRLAKKWHPDLFQDEAKIKEASRKMKEINEAYDILKDQKKRFAYDAESSSSVNIYEYYASKQTEERPRRRRKNKKSPDLENEKRRRAVLQFFEEEKKRRKDILDMVQELRECVVSEEFSDEEYIETHELILEELRDCIATIKSIISTAKEKQITGLEASFAIAEQIIAELTDIEKETPKTLKEAQYVEETKRLSQKIDELMQGFSERIGDVTRFDLLSKTWEFEDDSQVKVACEAHIREADELIADLQWVQKTAAERNIQIGLIDLEGFNLQTKGNLDYCIDKVGESKSVLQCSLQELREKFWKERCEYSEKSKGKKKVFEGVKDAEDYKGNFIVPPDIDVLGENAFRWLEKMNSITIPARLIYPGIEIALPFNYREGEETLKQIIFIFETHSEVVDISKIARQIITREGEYICIRDEFSRPSFALAHEKGAYIYDDEKLCKLNGVPDVKQLENISPWWELCRHWEGYPLQVHTWAQVVQKLPHPAIMQVIPTSLEAIRKWILLDKPNFDKVFSSVEEKFKKRVVRLYIALGALNGEIRHAQAEWLISRLDPSKMYRSRLERVPDRNKKNPDPVFSVPKLIVDVVQEFITDQEFLPYVFAFLEGHQLFESEAKKANVGISPEFIAKVAPQYIFREKVDRPASFIKELLETEEEIAPEVADRIVRIYKISQTKLEGDTKKNIIKTDDVCQEGVFHYRFLDTQSLQTYLIFEEEFKINDDSREMTGRYAVEAENVFLSNNSHAIEILNGEERIGVAILNLFDEGELFADIVLDSVTDKSIEFLEAVRRALIDQKNCNSLVTAISIGMNEPATTGRYNPWREVVKDADADWAKGVKWIKFEYLFENKLLGIFYKGYRARFILEGEGQHFDKPNPYISPKKERELERRRYERLNNLRWY